MQGLIFTMAAAASAAYRVPKSPTLDDAAKLMQVTQAAIFTSTACNDAHNSNSDNKVQSWF